MASSRKTTVHDEHVDDWLYLVGWRHVSTRDSCKENGCKCESTGECERRVFNHYMVEDPVPSPVSPGSSNSNRSPEQLGDPEHSAEVFPICVDPDTVGSVGVEEIRCARHTVGVCYRYYRANILDKGAATTMVSVAAGGYKSPCFNMSAYLLEMPRHLAPVGSVAMGAAEPEMCWVVARSSYLTTAFLENLCDIGISPILGVQSDITLEVLQPGSEPRTATFVTSDFVYAKGGPNALWNPAVSSCRSDCSLNSEGVRAVKTALVTVSVLLTPKSMWGGKNPTTKLVTYVVHNICYGRDL